MEEKYLNIIFQIYPRFKNKKIKITEINKLFTFADIAELRYENESYNTSLEISTDLYNWYQKHNKTLRDYYYNNKFYHNRIFEDKNYLMCNDNTGLHNTKIEVLEPDNKLFAFKKLNDKIIFTLYKIDPNYIGKLFIIEKVPLSTPSNYKEDNKCL